MNHAWARGLAPALLAVALAACGSAPVKSDAPATAKKTGAAASRHTAATRRSPYAPAQEDPGKRGNYTRGGLYAPHIQDSAPSGGIPDVDLIPEPVVIDEPHSRYGNRSPYTVLGKSYRVLDNAQGYDETGLASYYGNKFHGRRTSNLEVYDMYAFTAAHKTLPLPSFARVTNLSNGRSVVVRVNDRGPFHDGRIIDLSYAAAVKLGVDRTGTARVEVVGLSPGENARQDYDAVAANASAQPPSAAVAALPPGVHIATGRPQPAPPSALDKLVGALPIAAANAGERPPQQDAAATPTPIGDAGKYGNTDWRFDMRQDGRTMTADEFDAWMRSLRARVATGKPAVSVGAAGVERPGAPDPRSSSASTELPVATASAAALAQGTAVASIAAVPGPGAMPASPPAIATVAPAPGRLTLQVASFAAHDNAERALAMLNGAGITGARLLDADANGRRVWRLRVGPVDPSAAPELVARIQGLGFGQPQRVRE
jgi:rare lipoprotein A